MGSICSSFHQFPVNSTTKVANGYGDWILVKVEGDPKLAAFSTDDATTSPYLSLMKILEEPKAQKKTAQQSADSPTHQQNSDTMMRMPYPDGWSETGSILMENGFTAIFGWIAGSGHHAFHLPNNYETVYITIVAKDDAIICGSLPLKKNVSVIVDSNGFLKEANPGSTWVDTCGKNHEPKCVIQ